MASTQQAPRSFPSIEFTGAEAGLKEFPGSASRSYNYFTPQRARATMYEDVTVDVQPDPERHLSQGWIYGFADGKGGYPKDWTWLRSADWHRFLDPNEEWEQTIYRNNSNVVRQIQLNLQNAKNAGAYSTWTGTWVTFLERHLGAWMHAEHGLGMHVFTSEQRSAPTNMINTAIAVNSAHKLRFAQDLALYNLDLSEAGIGFDGAAHKQVWHHDPVWQGVRENVERLTAIEDWAESLFATNVVFEQLVGALFRSHLVMQVSARNNDYVTPTLVGTGEHDYDRDLRYTRALFRMLTADEAHGAHNRGVLQQWLERWVPLSVAAARTLQPIWSQPSDRSVTFATSFQVAASGLRSVLADLDLTEPKGLDK
ncbi:MAG TPA: aromatic/alkene monooxygenase hydroxylase subunit beta [Actinocrinis sp.]|uniref:aromatic/alkene monooxygenase hydroxylase subunit beta n=1 Tax=Actinocrinis sp. TaxID=1920516 RepID=UPI002DDCB245|nr:aromatic/alkene monooxygenase hydroxylase subunit beta [Actinocrinis sp.]HEV2346180.1 aromatic/alkene monooxygenase hydroxylase subunit beta [Actinocrinis sp.]